MGANTGADVVKQRVYELARQLGVESKELLDRAEELGLKARTASSGLEEDEAELLRLSYQEGDGSSVVEEQGTAPDVTEEVLPSDRSPSEGEVEHLSPVPQAQERELLELRPGVTVGEFAEAVGETPASVVKALMDIGEMVAASQPVPPEALALLAEQFGFRLAAPPSDGEVVAAAPAPPPEQRDRPEELEARPPVVTVMGHVDHGKTQLLDTIRRTNVVSGEAGGITQHIGAYQVDLDGRKITFIDTPGHVAFTALRARGAQITDIVVLVVAADDGVMPQTAEAISHAKAAGVPIVVAINKMDLPDADADRVRAQLTEYDLVAEQLGGDTVTVQVSALKNQGIDQLLEMIDLVAEVEDLRANPDAPASGTVIESQLDKGRGPVGTVIVQRGTLTVGDSLVAGAVAGRVRAMLDERGRQVKKALPSTAVLVMGWEDVPRAGDRFQVVADDKEARNMAQARRAELRSEELTVPSAEERLSQLLEQLRSGEEAELRLIAKADAHGSLEAIRDAVAKIGREGAHTTLIHAAVGGITENDIMLAQASQAVIIGFNVRPDAKARRAAEDDGIEVRTYRVIYDLLDDVEQMLLGRLAPEEVEDVLGVAQVRATFRVPRFGQVAGCYVTEGEVGRGARARLVRDGVVVYDGTIASLRRFKDDVRSVSAGFECGIGLENFSDVKEGDLIEAYQVREVARV
ncbi:MAG: translation initiation factor IF-2 [Actinomycetota bacterium]|nr:translation initiation factor IF-2 [Actinomycetota bacterium]